MRSIYLPLGLLLVFCLKGMLANQQQNLGSGKSVDTRLVLTNRGAMDNLLNHVDPVYPPLAKAAHIEGVVKFQIVISPQGKVTDIRLIEGHPLLVQAAKNALQQGTFKPFMIKDEAVPANATIEIPFSLGIPTEAAKREQTLSNDFYSASDECRSAYRAQQYAKADAACQRALTFVDQLPPDIKLNRVDAHELYGQVLLVEKKFSEAAGQFDQALSLAETFLRRDQAELAYAFYHKAIGDQVTGKPEEADHEYKEAEDILASAREKIGDDSLKRRYAATLKQILQFHATLMDQTGNTNASAELTKRANQISVP